MTGKKEKTISGAMYSAPNLEHLCYEIIWQIGDMRDTGFIYTPDDAHCAQDLLDEFAKYLLELPEVCVVTQKELDDPNWKPPFEAGLIVHHMVYHGDENSPHIHMTYIPYTTNSSKGAPIQNAFAQTFKDLGFPTTMRQAVTETSDLVWQKDEDGNLKPQMKVIVTAVPTGWKHRRQCFRS